MKTAILTMPMTAHAYASQGRVSPLAMRMRLYRSTAIAIAATIFTIVVSCPLLVSLCYILARHCIIVNPAAKLFSRAVSSPIRSTRLTRHVCSGVMRGRASTGHKALGEPNPYKSPILGVFGFRNPAGGGTAIPALRILQKYSAWRGGPQGVESSYLRNANNNTYVR